MPTTMTRNSDSDRWTPIRIAPNRKLIISVSELRPMSSTYGSRSRGRPLGITVLCLLGFVGTFFSFFGMLGAMGGGGPFAVLGLFGLALVVAKGVVLYGLWTLQYWGYKWAVILYGLSALLDLVSLNLLALIIDVLIVVYLMSKADHFR